MKGNDLTLIEKDRIVEATIKFINIIVGVSGNSLNLFVLTRNKLTTTSIYLLAISTVDLLRLLGNITICLEYFQWIHLGYENYWKIRPVFTAITFSAQAMSLIFIASFSIDRFIAINNPFKRHILNKKSICRCIIIITVIVCFLPRIPLALKIVLKTNVRYDEKTHKFCENATIKENLNNTKYDILQNDLMKSSNIMQLKHILLNDTLTKENMNETNTITIVKQNNTSSFNLTNSKIDNCTEIIYWAAEFRKQNRPPKWFRISIVTIYSLMPTLTLMFFNIKLIILLKKSGLKRSELTNSVALQQQVVNKSTPLISKENRAILQLITIKAAIALLRMPYFIMMYFLEILVTHRNAFKILSQISSISLDINATLNFFLFCVLPDNNRKQLIETMSKFCCRGKIETKTNKNQLPNKVSTTNSNGINNIAFIGDSQIPISAISNNPGEQFPQQSNQHRKLETIDSTSSLSSNSTLQTQTSQMSLTSESSVF